MLDIIKQNKIIIVVLIVIIGAFAYFGLSEQTASTSLLSTNSRADAPLADQEILRVLLDMRSIRLDDSIFRNPAFGSLRDYGRDIVLEPVGRRNPFTPAGTQSSNQTGAANAVSNQ